MHGLIVVHVALSFPAFNRARDRSYDYYRRAVAHPLICLLYCIPICHNSSEDSAKGAYCRPNAFLASGGSTEDTPTQPSDVEFLMSATLHCPRILPPTSTSSAVPLR